MFEGGASVAQNDTHNKRGAFLCLPSSSSGVNYIIITEGIRVRALKKEYVISPGKRLFENGFTQPAYIPHYMCVVHHRSIMLCLCVKQRVYMREKYV